MIQLEFTLLMATVARCAAKPGRRVPRKVLAFLRAALMRKFRHRLTDLDLLVLLALAHAGEPQRFTAVLDLMPGASQTGVWKALERLHDYGFITVAGKPTKHTYEISTNGVKELHNLTK